MVLQGIMVVLFGTCCLALIIFVGYLLWLLMLKIIETYDDMVVTYGVIVTGGAVLLFLLTLLYRILNLTVAHF